VPSTISSPLPGREQPPVAQGRRSGTKVLGLDPERDEERVVAGAGDVEQHAGSALDVRPVAERTPVLGRDRAEREVGRALLGDHEVRAPGSQHPGRGRLEAAGDGAERHHGRDADPDAEHGQQRAHALSRDVLEDQSEEGHALIVSPGAGDGIRTSPRDPCT
jgi:hypothetical protein